MNLELHCCCRQPWLLGAAAVTRTPFGRCEHCLDLRPIQRRREKLDWVRENDEQRRPFSASAVNADVLFVL
jgi:hypothetical protein